eukprot:jgi/Undpi1/7843/HiC_scaffold_23.g10315.m1
MLPVVNCAFAHGAQELRSLALDADRTCFDATGTRAVYFPQVATGGAAASCRDQRNDSGLHGLVLGNSAPSYAMDDANGRKYKADEGVPRRVFGSVSTRAIVGGEVPRHGFDEVSTKSVSTRPVVHATAATEAGVRGSIRGRKTWAKIARGGSDDGADNDPSLLQGNQYRELVEVSFCSGESSRPRSDVVYNSRHDIVPRTGDFSYFQTRRASHRSASIPPRRSPAGRPASSASVALMTAGSTVDWDPVRYDAPHLGDASTSFCDDKKQAAMEAGRANLTMQQTLDEDG